MTTNQKISARILEHVAAGMTLAQAIDAVLGAGAHARLAGDLYEALRVRS
jgi:hypothetical protein